ncbi:hypothetical protein TWF788_004201 [Orbilia oligospora]|uniref:Hydrophobin n=1 Tax=Orbilia oligospora TaxID=2813651 RepID=A0A6G1MHM1_ORBOL|nr:hypothetical protein TWF788_004201 [Orbilia oligospora]KAF3220276.1 hypothetical protein TWF679_009655 [Orbilia oligospora]KAF3221045.1 hypothetical protein TWF191_007253 [Orbilia oligospora]KAF3259033.1 hypothetical protein TWF192_011166 [Orbilia oligospora]
MKFLIACTTALSAGAYALPYAAPLDEVAKPAAYEVCEGVGIRGTFPACCETVHLGLISINCTPLSKDRYPASKKEFIDLCTKEVPQCCWLDPKRGTINSVCQNPNGF